jgi:hypothetical protein
VQVSHIVQPMNITFAPPTPYRFPCILLPPDHSWTRFAWYHKPVGTMSLLGSRAPSASAYPNAIWPLQAYLDCWNDRLLVEWSAEGTPKC